MDSQLMDKDAVALAALIRDGRISPSELVQHTLSAIDAVNPELNAVIHRMDDEAQRVAQHWEAEMSAGRASNAPFCGVPFLLKDLLAEYKGAPFNEGCRALKDNVSTIDTELVRRQREAGFIVCGKTNTPEFGGSPVTEPELHGVTRNPWNTEHTPGGSSGGSAAMVAAGVVPMAHANDGGGSIRIPAACCGLFGLKPTRGRNPLGPLFGDLGSGIIYEHVVSRSVRDSAAMLDVTAGSEVGEPYPAPQQQRPYLEEVSRDPGQLKIGFLTRLPDGWHETTTPHADCVAGVNDTAKLLEGAGHAVEEVNASIFAQPDLPGLFGPRFGGFVAHVMRFWERHLGRALTRDDVEDATWDWYQGALASDPAAYLEAVESAQLFTRRIARWYEDEKFDVLLTPTLAVPPVRIGAFTPSDDKPGQWLIDILNFVAFTYAYNLTGQPAMSVPLVQNAAGLPIGMQFIGPFGDEATLFRLAAQLEQIAPWTDRRPPVHISNHLNQEK